MFLRPLALLLVSAISLSAAELKIAVLHPLLGDLARQIGGERVQVVDLIGPNGDPHHFEPKATNLREAEGAKLYLAAGMDLEGYLPKLKTILADKATLVEVGATLPVLADTDSDHGHATDPHWWHSIDRFRRAVGIVTAAMAAADPDNAAEFRKNAETYREQLNELERWARREIAKIPRDRRQLATTHSAFNYFSKDWGFTPHSVQGLSHEQTPDPTKLAALIAELKSAHVTVIFPEKESNPKILATLTQDTGIRLGDPLIADGTGGISYTEMVRHNVTAIVKALAQ
jgi:zinc/manganese transport system substrate-binding protein